MVRIVRMVCDRCDLGRTSECYEVTETGIVVEVGGRTCLNNTLDLCKNCQESLVAAIKVALVSTSNPS